jgi:hypothetical protein
MTTSFGTGCRKHCWLQQLTGTLLWEVAHVIAPDDGLDKLGAKLTIVWVMIAA